MDAEATKGRREESLVSSLSALRAIEQERLAEEHAATAAALVTSQRARQAAEAARIAAERQAQLAAEAARLDAERQDRLRIEAAEAAERARRLIALDERRLDEELALRKLIALRTRPRWMTVVTTMAVVAALGAGGLALEARGDEAAAVDDRDRAIEARRAAERARGDAEVAMRQLAREVDDLGATIKVAIQRSSENLRDAERRQLNDRLRELDRQRAETLARQRQAELERQRRERATPLAVPAECRNNVLCK